MELLHLMLVVAVVASSVKVSHQGPNERRLLTDLMKDYSKLDRPVNNDSEALTVNVGLSFLQIMDVDEKNQVFITNNWLQLGWNDYKLQWDPKKYPGVPNVRLPPNLVWKPDILLYNSADERFDATFHTNVLVNNSGSCTFMPPGIFKSTCSINVRWFPFDVQKCELKFGSWTYNGLKVDLKFTSVDTDAYIQNSEWELVEVTGQRNEVHYACCEEPYVDVTFTVWMRRRTLFYGLNLLFPCVLLSIMAVLVFLLPADSGEKISLGITVLLSLTVFMLLVSEVMPATSDSVPLIAQYFAATLVIVGLSLIATVVVLQYHHQDPNGEKMSKWTRVILLNWCAWFLCMKRPNEGQSDCHNKAQEDSLSSIERHATTPATKTMGGKGGEENVEPELAKILEQVRFIAKRFCDQDKNKSVSNEWKFAAAVIDRVCLVAFTIITFLCAIGILMSAPSFDQNIS
ncbi:neuronal acetylcholine receptor subunit alpha-7 [Solea senegalensis]|uniref:Neuronal acetylcholine receptor subunit alpha-7 n=2 Tax=Solea senegalensis TaxID=28829 RepID=A0AAV6Q7V9_SOLSE|nr:neuronal acetylcholine receptor subunit alpha-7-like [Solea senegalensis]KAG7483154.1 neuronal acetylcholine receptor subunit alpha-7 [Solea senegalensis]